MAIEDVESLNFCCHNRYKKPLQTDCFSLQPGLGLNVEKSFLFNAPVDFTAAPKSLLGVIQLDRVVFSVVSGCLFNGQSLEELCFTKKSTLLSG